MINIKTLNKQKRTKTTTMHTKTSKKKKITMPIKISKRKRVACLTFYAFYCFYASEITLCA